MILRFTTVDVTTGSSVFSTLLFHQLIPPREVLRSNLAPDRQYRRTTTTTWFCIKKSKVAICPRFSGTVSIFNDVSRKKISSPGTPICPVLAWCPDLSRHWQTALFHCTNTNTYLLQPDFICIMYTRKNRWRPGLCPAAFGGGPTKRSRQRRQRRQRRRG